ncbi:MAG TPA: M20/M25/M40 family metallo-hydrolase [Anaerolineaceae bacterium]
MLVIILCQVQVRAANSPCGYHDLTSNLINQTSQASWAGWIERLSGETSVEIGGQLNQVILTRYSPAMFGGYPNSRGFQYVLEQVRNWYPDSQIEIDPYHPYPSTNPDVTWYNLVVTIPGSVFPQEEVLLTAHLDSIVTGYGENPHLYAPGAEDNASGSAALLEAARIFRYYQFNRTIRFIWFTGEEQGLLGSKAFVMDHPVEKIVGVINLDMFGYDSDNDGCFELHVGNLPASQTVGQCFDQSISDFAPGLKRKFITSVMDRSDHAPFWSKGIGAVEVLENYGGYYTISSNTCTIQEDRNPSYHRYTDTITNLNLTSGFEIVKASLAALSGLAEPLGLRGPVLSVKSNASGTTLSWVLVPGASRYHVNRSERGCSSGMEYYAETTSTEYLDTPPPSSSFYFYTIEALDGNGFVFAPLSNCAPLPFSITLPWIHRE